MPKPVLMHRETQIVVMDDDSALGANSKVLRTLEHLRNSGFTQGRSLEDTGGAFYNLGGGPIQPIPPLGTPGDFMIMKQEPGKTVTIAFTRAYGGIVDVPPNMDAAGNPREDWTAVNGWTVASTKDGNSPAVTYAPGQQKLWLDKSVSGTTENIWAIQDFSHPAAGVAYPTSAGGGTWTGAGFSNTVGAIWGGPDGAGRDEVYLGRKFTIPNVSANPGDHHIRVRADDGAAVFINGQLIGSTASGYTAWTDLPIPPGVLRPGENIITTHAIDRGGPGGIEMEVIVNTSVVANTSAAQASQWQILNSPAVSTPDEMTLTKTFTLTSPDGILTGHILPGEFVDISWSGVNTGPHQISGIGALTTIDTGAAFPYTTISTTAHAVLLPDRAVMTITNAKGTFTIPLTQFDQSTGEWVKKDEGSGTFHIPSDYLASGGNTMTINVERGGIVQQFAMNEPPSSPPSGNFYRNLSEPQVQAAGYWVNAAPLRDDDNTILVPMGSLFYGGKLVKASDLSAFPPDFFDVGSGGVIYRVDTAVQPGDFSFRPDSYINRSGPSTIDSLPIFVAGPGFRAYEGYQLKKDIRTGMAMTNKDTSQEIHTYATKHYERYTYDPNTQTIMDIMAADQGGLEGIDGDGGGSETQDILYTGGTDQVNTRIPLMLGPDGTVLQNNGVADPGGKEIHPGSTGIGKAPVGIRISRTDRQTFGSDDNELTRALYAALKPIDLDGYNEDLNGNGILDAGEDTNGNGLLENGTMEADSRAYREYRDVFNMGLLDHIYISGTAYAPSGGGFSSVIEFNWKATDVKTKTADHVTQLGTVIHGTDAKTLANSYMNNYEYFANETDRRNKKYTVVRRGDMLMNSFYSFRKEA
jgi:hypothetical protein